MGTSTNLIAAGLAIAAATAAIPGCKESESFGYVQIKRDIKIAANDVYLLNGEAIADIARNEELVLKQKTGTAKLVLVRGGGSWTLCTFELRKNRVVSALLTSVRGKIQCSVQG